MRYYVVSKKMQPQPSFLGSYKHLKTKEGLRQHLSLTESVKAYTTFDAAKKAAQSTLVYSQDTKDPNAQYDTVPIYTIELSNGTTFTDGREIQTNNIDKIVRVEFESAVYPIDTAEFDSLPSVKNTYSVM